MRQTNIIPASEEAIAEGARLLRAGRLVVFPTDTVYGVGADLANETAVDSLFEAKGRSAEKAIPLLIASADFLALVAESVSAAALRLTARYWPGGLTIIVRKSARVPDIVTGGKPTVAVRMPDHPVAISLIAAAGGAIAATSANRSGEPSPVTAQEAAAQLDGRVDLIIDGGRCPGGVASSIVDLTFTTPRLLRAGAISLEELEKALGAHLERL
jgi:L-threonylcarbamoyladenylate synthase